MNTKEERLVSNSQLHKMLHALGIEYTTRGKTVEPHKRYNPLPVSYRNYYQTAHDTDWEILVEMGYAIKKQHLNLNWYLVTAEGIEFLKELGYKFKKDKS